MTGAPAGIHAEVTEHPGWRRTLTITVPADAVKTELDASLRSRARDLKLPGFRKGKAPLSAIRRRLGASAENETLQRVMESAYRVALAERALQPVSEGEIDGVDYRPESGLTFRISFDVRPTPELARLDGFEVVLPRVALDAGAVDHALEALRMEHAIWRPPDEPGPPGRGDLVTVRMIRADDGRPPDVGETGLPWARRLELRADSEHRGRYQFVLGQGDAVPELEAAVGTLMPGETAEWSPTGDTSLRVTLEGRQVRELPEIDDLFAQSLGDFDGLASLRAELERDLLRQAEERAKHALRDRLLDLVVQANPFEVPRSMVERFAGVQGGEIASIEQAECSLKRVLVVEAVADRFGLHATAAEVDGRLADLARRGGVDPERVRARLVKTGRMDRWVGEITDEKVFEFLERRSRILPEEAP